METLSVDVLKYLLLTKLSILDILRLRQCNKYLYKQCDLYLSKLNPKLLGQFKHLKRIVYYYESVIYPDLKIILTNKNKKLCAHKELKSTRKKYLKGYSGNSDQFALKYLRRLIFREDNVQFFELYLYLFSDLWLDGQLLFLEMFNRGASKCVDYYIAKYPDVDKIFQRNTKVSYFGYQKMLIRCFGMNYVQFAPLFRRKLTPEEIHSLLFNKRYGIDNKKMEERKEMLEKLGILL